MAPARELITLDDIQLLVDTFYTRVQQDELLSPIFNERIQNNWKQHLQKMYAFWQTVLLEEHTYFGAPFRPHATMPIDAAHFQQWLNLFTQTVDELFTGDKAAEAKWRAGKMAELFEAKRSYIRDNQQTSIL